MMRCAAAIGLVCAVSLGALGGSSAGAQGETAERPAPRVVADYRFGGNLNSSVAGAPRLRNVSDGKANAFVKEVVDGTRRTVLRFPEKNGLRLPNATSIVRATKYTIAVRMRFDSVLAYNRIISFDGAVNDTGLYVYNGLLSPYPYPIDYSADPVIEDDEWVDVVLTRTAEGRLRGYVDGALQFDVQDTNPMSVIVDPFELGFFRDNSNREESSGAVSRIRIWNGPLTAAQVAVL